MWRRMRIQKSDFDKIFRTTSYVDNMLLAFDESGVLVNNVTKTTGLNTYFQALWSAAMLKSFHGLFFHHSISAGLRATVHWTICECLTVIYNLVKKYKIYHWIWGNCSHNQIFFWCFLFSNSKWIGMLVSIVGFQ